LYKKYAEQLVKEGKAYYCFCEPERLEKIKKEQMENKKAPMYDRYCLENLSEEQINKNLKSNCPYVIRLKIPKGEIIEFDDVIRGKMKIDSDTIDDQVILKSDGYPTYHLAHMVDDHLMEISHVIRGEEWLPSTAKHIILYKYFGWEIPTFAHIPLLLNSDKSKLSKRQGDVSVEDYVKNGYLKEAIINFVALLGWNPGQGSTREIFLLEELVKEFNLEKVHKAGAVFDTKKLDWINNQYIKNLSIDELYQKSLDFFKEKEFFKNASDDRKSEKYLKKVLEVEQERLVNLSSVGESDRYFFEDDLNYNKDDVRWKKNSDEETKEFLEKSSKVLENISDWSKEKIEAGLLQEAGDKRGDLLFPLRWALTGQKFSPTPFEVSWVLGKEESLRRIKKALELFN
jgi:glutamyl-tRNA synthetase